MALTVSLHVPLLPQVWHLMPGRYVCTTHACLVVHKKGSDHPELGQQMVPGSHVDVRSQTWVLWKSCWRMQPASHLTSPPSLSPPIPWTSSRPLPPSLSPHPSGFKALRMSIQVLSPDPFLLWREFLYFPLLPQSWGNTSAYGKRHL